MPTVLLHGRYRFFFYSREPGEPPHIHVEHDDKVAKYWLEPVALADSRRFRDHELRALRDLVNANRQRFLDAWHEHFDSQN